MAFLVANTNANFMARPMREFTRFIWWMQTKRQAATNPQTKPTDLGCESTCRGCYRLHPPSPFIIITRSAQRLVLTLPSHKG